MGRRLEPGHLAAFQRRLLEEEREAATIEKYLREVGVEVTSVSERMYRSYVSPSEFFSKLDNATHVGITKLWSAAKTTGIFVIILIYR